MDILVSGTMQTTTTTAEESDDAAKQLDQGNKRTKLKHYASFTESLSEKNNTQIDNVKDLDVATQMYNSIEYSDNCSKISGILRQLHKDDLNNNITESKSLKYKIVVSLKY